MSSFSANWISALLKVRKGIPRTTSMLMSAGKKSLLKEPKATKLINNLESSSDHTIGG